MNAPNLRMRGPRLTDWLRPGRASGAGVSAREPDRRAAMADITDFLSTHDLSVTPHNLRIAHDHVGGDPATCAAIADLLAEHGCLSDDVLGELAAPTAGLSATVVSDVAGALTQRLAEVIQIVAASQESARGYGVALDEQMQVAVVDPIKALDRLIPLTRGVVAANRRMEEQLHRARQETDTLRAKVQSARRDAERDHLTGLPNRRSFDARLADLPVDAKAVVAILDIDDFKTVNDRHGHEAGDRVLRFVARLLESDLRRHAVVARYGGEEFVCLFESSTIEAAHDRLETVRTALSRRTLVNQETGARVGPLTFSAGLSVVGDDTRAAMRRADDALYRAKGSGKDCLVIG